MRAWTKLIASLATGVVIGAQCAPASADYALRAMPMDKCLATDPTPEGSVPSAWHLDRLGMEETWKVATGKGVKVAVLDTGTSTLGSPFLNDGRIHTFDFLGDPDDPQQPFDCLHGTSVVSLLAAGRGEKQEAIHPTSDFSGIAPEVEVFAYRTLWASQAGAGVEESVLPAVLAVNEAIARDVDIINISQAYSGTPEGHAAFKDAIGRAIAAGIVVVAAAGNADAQLSGPAYPASFDGVIAVGMSDAADAAYIGTYASDVNVISVGAPGVDLLGLVPSVNVTDPGSANQAFASDLTGTSFATPLVSGVAALVIQHHREMNPGAADLTAQEMRTLLIGSADAPPSAYMDKRIGFGIVNPLNAVTGSVQPLVSASDTAAVVPDSVLIEPETPNNRPGRIGLIVGVAAVAATVFGVVAAIAIPAARRRSTQ